MVGLEEGELGEGGAGARWVERCDVHARVRARVCLCVRTRVSVYIVCSRVRGTGASA